MRDAMTRPTCVTCATVMSREGDPWPRCDNAQSPFYLGQIIVPERQTCTHHTPTARDAGTEDGNGE